MASPYPILGLIAEAKRSNTLHPLVYKPEIYKALNKLMLDLSFSDGYSEEINFSDLTQQDVYSQEFTAMVRLCLLGQQCPDDLNLGYQSVLYVTASWLEKLVTESPLLAGILARWVDDPSGTFEDDVAVRELALALYDDLSEAPLYSLYHQARKDNFTQLFFECGAVRALMETMEAEVSTLSDLTLNSTHFTLVRKAVVDFLKVINIIRPRS